MWGETRGGSITLSSPKRHFGLQTVNLHKTLNEYIFGRCMLYKRERESQMDGGRSKWQTNMQMNVHMDRDTSRKTDTRTYRPTGRKDRQADGKFVRGAKISGVSSGCQQAGCLTCSDFNGCLSCKPRLFMHLERIGMKQIGVCLTSCPPGFYGTRTPEINSCTSINLTAVAYIPDCIPSDTCTHTLTPCIFNAQDTLDNLTGLNKLWRWVHVSLSECRSDCDSCFNRNFCIRCRAGFYLHQGKCQENCPEGVARSDTQRECVPMCPAECESCVNSETCERCRPGLYQLNGRCHHVCPEDYEPNDKLMECTAQVHCEVGEWSEWSPCSRSGRTCGFKRGQETRTRQVLQYPSPFGNPCPEISEIKECLVKRRKCPGGRRKSDRRERRNRNNRKDKENQEGRRERKRERERDTGEREDSDNRNKTEHRHRRGHDTDPVSTGDGLVQ
ncbi:R-spondin-3 [Nibea albiflora]|uniref:R-spondin-3 n=1 Tax=Nibea albiflora TaxID=240163 RepID=A0ACB7F8K1_NIBAL|nr:R-spondin-3 [Nibea albiflora]